MFVAIVAVAILNMAGFFCGRILWGLGLVANLAGAAPVQSLGHAGTFTPATGGAVTLSGAAAVESLSHNGVFTPSATSATVARPSTTLSNAGWIPSAGVALPAMINEAAPNDADFIYASGAGNTCEIGLSATAHPGASQQIVRYRAQSVLGGLGVIVSLKQGATVIASWTHTTLPTAMTTFERTLTPPKIALIAPGPVSLELTTI